MVRRLQGNHGRLLLAGLLCAAGCSARQALRIAAEAPATRQEWRYQGAKGSEIETAHYRVRTTCTDRDLLRRLPNFLEGCWVAYAELLPPRREPRERALAYLFQRRPEWERFTQEFSPLRAPVYLRIRSGGYEERGVTVSHYGSMATLLSVLGHEGLHQFLSLTRGGNLPAWVNEGLACYFEAFELDNEGRPTFLPRENLIRRNHLRDAYMANRLFPLAEILSTNAGRVVGQSGERVKTYYAQLWSLVLFLLEEDPLRSGEGAGFRKLLGDLGTGAMDSRLGPNGGARDAGEAVFRRYVSEDLAGFERRYRAFVERLLRIPEA